MTTPNRGIPYVPQGTLDPAAGLNDALDVIDAIIIPRVISMALTAPPGSPQDGDLYIPASPATGAWAGLENQLVRYRTEGSLWQSYDAESVYVLVNSANGALYVWDFGSPGTWDQVTSGSVENLSFQVAMSDMTTDITTGTGKAYLRAPRGFTLTEVRASLFDASSSGVVTVDINVNGSTILSTKLTIDATELTSETAATPPVISSASIADDDSITFDIDTAGTDAKGLIVTLIGTA